VNIPPSILYAGPFVLFVALLPLQRVLPWPPVWLNLGYVAVMLLALATVWRRIPDLQLDKLAFRNWFGSAAIGVIVFVAWVVPDMLFPGYRHNVLFENFLTGTTTAGLSEAARTQPLVLWLRAFRAVIIVPIVEELFWRAWMMRWIIVPDFLSIPLGTWSARAFWVVALLFAAEHGPMWDAGLFAGVLYNWWMVRTRSLGDLILVHAISNACISIYVVAAGRWAYWS
jgi:CAAX prenyl protease-like protein